MAYSVLADIQRTFGARNVADWCDPDKDGNPTTMADRWGRAIVLADDEIDTVLRNGPYTIPLADLSGSTPTLINEISATLAGIWLYEIKGVSDTDPKSGQPIHRYQTRLNWARQTLNDIRDGKRVIQGMK
jgi:hypothetical protein